MREEIKEFAEAMEEKMKLREADWGDEWKDLDISFLYKRLDNEYQELLSYETLSRPEPAQRELVDVANFCMFLWHRLEESRASARTQHLALEIPLRCEGCGGEMKEIGNEDDSAIICPNCDIWTPRAVERVLAEKYPQEQP